MCLVEFKDVCKNYGSKQVLKNISFKIEKGKIIGLLGRNGMGKSTILKLINDLLTPSSGEVLVKGIKVGVESKKIISFLPERTYLDKSCTINQIFDFFLDFYQDFDVDKARMLLKDLDLDENAKISKMSKGMIEKLQLVLVMSRNAELYVLDEPLGGVDPATREYILDTILKNYNPDASIIISTHLISDIEKILDDIIIIERGEILLNDSVENLREQYNESIDEIFRRMFKC